MKKEDKKVILEALLYVLNKQTVEESYVYMDRCTVWGTRESPDPEAQEIVKKIVKIRGKDK